MSSSPRLEDLNDLYERLSPEERDELLQGLLIAAPLGGEAMVKLLEDTLLCHATGELIDDIGDRRREWGSHRVVARLTAQRLRRNFEMPERANF